MHIVSNSEFEAFGSITSEEYQDLPQGSYTSVAKPEPHLKVTRTVHLPHTTLYPGDCILCREN